MFIKMDSYSKNPMLNSSQESVKNPSLFENSSNSRDEILSTEQVVMEDALFKNNELATTNSFDEVFESSMDIQSGQLLSMILSFSLYL